MKRGIRSSAAHGSCESSTSKSSDRPALAIAFVLYPLLAAIGGRVREVHWPNWVLAGLIVLRYVLV